MAKILADPTYWTVDEICRELGPVAELNLDLETSGFSPFKDQVAVVAMHDPDSGATGVCHVRGAAPPRLVEMLNRPGRRINTHNGTAFDIPFLSRWGVDVFGGQEWYDTMTGELATLATNRRDVSVSLKATQKRRLGYSAKKEIDHGGWMNPVLTDEQKEYVLGDIKDLHKIRQKQEEKVRGTLQERALRTEMRLIPCVVNMQLGGLPLDRPALDSYLASQHLAREESAERLYQVLGNINLRSAPQLRAALQASGVPVMSTAYEVLRQVELFGGPAGELCGLVLRWRHADQRIKMYTEEWVRQYCVEHPDGSVSVHAKFWPCGTDTGRFSSSEPNLQQVPRDMRWVFGGKPGYVVLSADYAQIEVRCAAELADDQALIEAFERGEGDSHRSIAADIFEKSADRITKDERQASKAATFCLLFAGGAKTLFNYARMSGGTMDLPTAHRVATNFFGKYRGLASLQDHAVYQAQMNRPVTITLPTGLKRVLSGASLTPMQILNTAIQGSAAAGIKFAMLECHRRGLTGNGDPHYWVGAQVHDELVAVVREDLADWYAGELEEAMKDGMRKVLKKCPVEVEIKRYQTGHWGERVA